MLVSDLKENSVPSASKKIALIDSCLFFVAISGLARWKFVLALIATLAEA
jgi:hypothetical protein